MTTHRIASFALAGAAALAAAACVPEAETPTTPATAAETPGSIQVAGRCRQINIGTPQNPRYVRDPACGSGSGR